MDKTNLDKKRERFKIVAARRVQKVLDSIDNLSKCANKGNYEYSEEEIRKMFRVINDRLALLKAAYTASSRPGKRTFEF